jgi:hypothetical protein
MGDSSVDSDIQRRQFIAIATSEYSDRRFPRLRCVPEEVAAIKGWLCDESLGDRRFEHMHKDLAGNPSEDAIRSVFKGVEDHVWKESTAAVIFITGHGIPRDGAHWLVLKDTKSQKIRNTAMRTSEIVAWLAESGPRQLILILDTRYMLCRPC